MRLRFGVLAVVLTVSLAACEDAPYRGSLHASQQSALPAASSVLTCPPAPAACRDFQRDQLNDPRDPDWKLWIDWRAPGPGSPSKARLIRQA
jgi:hypothetical protein